MDDRSVTRRTRARTTEKVLAQTEQSLSVTLVQRTALYTSIASDDIVSLLSVLFVAASQFIRCLFVSCYSCITFLLHLQQCSRQLIAAMAPVRPG